MKQEWIFRFDNFFLDLNNRLLVKDREPIHLSPKAFNILSELVRAHGQLVSKDQLLDRVWPDTHVSESNIFHAISVLRKALASGHSDRLDRYIANVSGTGYKFIPHITKVPSGTLTASLRPSAARALRVSDQPLHEAQDPNNHNGSPHCLQPIADPAHPPAIEPGRYRAHTRRCNLPAQPTPLIGRHSEVAYVTSLIRRQFPRLITLTGAGGSGKTRVAIQAAEEAKLLFPDLISFISLGHVLDPDLVAPTIAQALGLRDDAGSGGHILDSIKRRLANKHALLVVDNFEQVIAAAGLLADLLASCPSLKLIVTSRMPLNLRAEHPFVIQPLSIPPIKIPKSIDALLDFGSVVLLIDRARSSAPDFQLTPSNAQAVAAICRKLDGLPLAIELVAPRLKLLTPHQLLDALDSSIDSTGSAPRDLPARQQTIRKTIEWSYDLLTDDEKTLFRRLSVFVGGFTLDAAESVCNKINDLTIDVSLGLASLVDKNMVYKSQNPNVVDQVRFGQLETAREVAREILSSSAEEWEVQSRHAGFICRLVEETEPRLTTSEVIEALDLLQSEIGNIRAALAFASTGQAHTGVRIVGALRKFWITRGFAGEGARWISRFIAATTNSMGVAAGKFLAAAGAAANYRGNHLEAADLFGRALKFYTVLGDTRGIADMLGFKGAALSRQGCHSKAKPLVDHALNLAREIDDRWLIGDFLVTMATVAHHLGHDYQSFALNSEAVEVLMGAGNKTSLACALNNLGVLEAHAGQVVSAQRKLSESLVLAMEVGAEDAAIRTLESFAELASLEERFDRVVSLIAATVRERSHSGAPIDSRARLESDELLAVATSHLSNQLFDAAWRAGQAMSIEEAVEYALGDDPGPDLESEEAASANLHPAECWTKG